MSTALHEFEVREAAIRESSQFGWYRECILKVFMQPHPKLMQEFKEGTIYEQANLVRCYTREHLARTRSESIPYPAFNAKWEQLAMRAVQLAIDREVRTIPPAPQPEWFDPTAPMQSGVVPYPAGYEPDKTPTGRVTLGPAFAALPSAKIQDNLMDSTGFTCSKTPDIKSFLEGINMHPAAPAAPTVPEFFATQYLLEGRVLSALPDQEVYAAIKRKEEKIATLKAVKSKPDRLKAQIKQEQADLRAFILFLNEQDAA